MWQELCKMNESICKEDLFLTISLVQVQHTNMEEVGFMIYVAASQQVAIKIFSSSYTFYHNIITRKFQILSVHPLKHRVVLQACVRRSVI